MYFMFIYVFTIILILSMKSFELNADFKYVQEFMFIQKLWLSILDEGTTMWLVGLTLAKNIPY